ncbi:hypothetical protein, partial [Burkholderia sp. Leaf177]|uniref:hypothetical protein n=1 Tax=Burkholderia sp. Leaf177 TaxID=1736287 RepID=UPI001F2104E6
VAAGAGQNDYIGGTIAILLQAIAVAERKPRRFVIDHRSLERLFSCAPSMGAILEVRVLP